MDPLAILIIGGLVFPARISALPPDRTTEYLAVAAHVAGSGKPGCTTFSFGDTTGACLPRYTVKRGRQINAWAYQGNIQFSSAAIGRLTNDQFALLAGHEIAHFYLGHTQSSVTTEL